MEVNVKRLLVRLDKAQGREDERIWLRQVIPLCCMPLVTA